MAKKETVMIDSMGAEVPLRYVNRYDRERDRIVNRIYKRWETQRARLDKEMADTLADLDKLAVARGEAGLDATGAKGNMQVSSFDGLTTVSVNVRYNIVLDDRVIQARDMLLAYVRGIIAKLDNDEGEILFKLVSETFQTNSSGMLSHAKVMRLINYNIKAKAWVEAVELLQASIETHRGKSYLRVERKPSRQHDPVPIRLDIADCWPEPSQEV